MDVVGTVEVVDAVDAMVVAGIDLVAEKSKNSIPRKRFLSVNIKLLDFWPFLLI